MASPVNNPPVDITTPPEDLSPDELGLGQPEVTPKVHGNNGGTRWTPWKSRTEYLDPAATPTGDMSYSRSLEYSCVETWLDEHPDFVADYFSRKASKVMVDAWLVAHTLSGELTTGIDSGSPTGAGTTLGTGSRPGSGSNTPVRKISTQELDRTDQILTPIVSTSTDGTPTFIRSRGSTGFDPHSMQPRHLRKTVSELKALDERELMYELVMDVCNDLDITSLCHKILKNVGLLMNADRCSLFLVTGRDKPAEAERYLVSRLFDVTAGKTLEETLKNGQELRVPMGSGIVGYVAQTGKALNIPDAYKDTRFNADIDLKTGYKTHSILSMPIHDLDGEVVGVAQAVNKTILKDQPFDDHDEKVFSSYLSFCGIGIRNAQMYERSLLENKRNQLLLDLARVIFEEQSNVANLIHKIMMHTQAILQCERCQVLLVQEACKDKNNKLFREATEGTFSQVFDLEANDFDNDDSYHREGQQEPRFPINIGITGFVAKTGETLNIPDAYKDCRFDPKVDDGKAFRHQTILCMPIRNSAGHVIGVSQFVNKLDRTSFNQNDENLFEAFAIFCGMGIHNTQMYEKVVHAMAKRQVALEVLSYHAAAPIEDVRRMKKSNIPSVYHYKLLSPSFDDMLLTSDDTLKACVRMFEEMDFINKFHINMEVFWRWVLSVKKNYRNVTYHNWRHAFNVTQTMFWILKKCRIQRVLGDYECLALMIGSLCHDLDHRGTNNQFQINTMSPLAKLYSTSVLEHHHFDHCIMILNTKGNEILAHLKPDEYKRVINVLEGAILATDLALYFRHRGDFFQLIDNHSSDWNRETHRSLLRSMLMTACDIAAITKPWEIQQQVAFMVASEFFEQGDIERRELKMTPSAMMDRNKEDQLPALQVDFIDSICIPVYQALTKVDSSMKPMLDGVKINRNNWLAKAAEIQKKLAEEEEETASDYDDLLLHSQREASNGRGHSHQPPCAPPTTQ